MSSGVDHRPALALGGGIARAGDVCGAVTGGAIAIGQLCADQCADSQEAKDRSGRLALPFYRDFVAEFGHADCRSLTGMDISTDEGFRAFQQSTLKADRCTHFVTFAARRLASLGGEVG